MPTFDQRLTELRALAEPSRLRLLRLLDGGELTVSEATAILGQAQPSVSRHLRLLCDAGLVHRHQDGAWVFYGAVASPFAAAVIGGLTGPAFERDEAALAEVRSRRTRQADAYFAAHAARWDALRRRYLAAAATEAAMRSLSGAESGTRFDHVIDLGTGTGRMLVLFGGTFARATGFDTSPEMLAVARAALTEAGLSQATARRGDIHALPEDAAPGDLILLHHVLHYSSDPAAAIRSAASRLADGGQVLIADLAPHDREGLRVEHAHRRLGFSDEAVAAMAEKAGLTVTGSVAIPAPPSGLASTVWRLEKAKERRPTAKVGEQGGRTNAAG